MRFDQENSRRCLIDLAGLDADQPVLDVVDPPHAMFASDLVQPCHQLDRLERLAIECDRSALFEAYLDVAGLRRRVLGRARPLVDIRRRLDIWVFQDPGFDAATPETLV